MNRRFSKDKKEYHHTSPSTEETTQRSRFSGTNEGNGLGSCSPPSVYTTENWENVSIRSLRKLSNTEHKRLLLDGIAARLEKIEEYITARSKCRGPLPRHLESFSQYEKIMFPSAPPKGPKLRYVYPMRVERQNNFSSMSHLVQMGHCQDYLDFIVENGDFESSVLILAEIYLRHSIQCDRSLKLVKPEGVKVLYGVCLFLAYKFLIEDDYWPLSEFCHFIGVDKIKMFKYELFVCDKVLQYKLGVSLEEYNHEHELLENIGLVNKV